MAEWISKRLSGYHGIETIGTFKVPDTVERPVKDRPEMLNEARSIGENAASLANCLSPIFFTKETCYPLKKIL